MANERHTDFREWDVDSSTRQSVHPYNRYVAISNAASTIAETVFELAANGGEKATNWVLNPGVEGTNIDAFVVTGSAASRRTAQQAEGAASLLVNPANSAVGEGIYWVSPKIPFSINEQHITVQCEHRGASASGTVEINIMDSAGTTELASSGSSSLATSWTAINTQYSVPASTAGASYRLYVVTQAQHNINFYLDKIMFEIRDDTTGVSTYLDGNQTGAEGSLYEWTGTANLSTSIKKPAMNAIRGFQFKNQSATAADIIYIAFDTTATASNGIPIYGGQTLDSSFPLDFRGKISMIAAQNTPTLSGVVWGIAE